MKWWMSMLLRASWSKYASRLAAAERPIPGADLTDRTDGAKNLRIRLYVDPIYERGGQRRGWV